MEQKGIVVEMFALSVRTFSIVLLFGLRQTPKREDKLNSSALFLCVPLKFQGTRLLKMHF